MTVLLGLPILSLALNALAWLIYGFDLPFYDDWRAYATGQIDSFEPKYLFAALNDTMAPVGFALDALAQRTLHGNSVAYQLISMLVVLGALLLLQWRLLRASLGSKMQTAVCFVFTLPMLQPGSYWGRENLAYHQALPIVFILAALCLITARTWSRVWLLPAIFSLGLLAGFSYISGAFGALAAGAAIVALVLLGGSIGPQRKRALQGGAVLTVAGVIAATTQFVFAVLPSFGATHRPDAPIALPIEADFWLFYMGKIGRSLLLAANTPLLSFWVVVSVCALAIWLGARLFLQSRAAPNECSIDNAVLVYGGLAAMVGVYLLLVAAGRTNLRPPDTVRAQDIFAHGFTRFHFFWATVVWPWVIAAALLLARQRGWLEIKAMRLVGTVGVAGAILLMILGGAMSHMYQHSMEAHFRRPTIACLMQQLQRGEGIDCQEFNMPDWTPAYLYASKIDASFVRYVPVLPLELGIDTPSPWFRLSRDKSNGETRWHDVSPGLVLPHRAGQDAQLHVNLAQKSEMATCVLIDVRGSLKTQTNDTSRLYYRPLGQMTFEEHFAQSVFINAESGPALIYFRIESSDGFENSLRLDPVVKAQDFDLSELEVRCRLRKQLKPFLEVKDVPLAVERVNLDSVEPMSNRFRAGEDGRFLFSTGRPDEMASCSMLDIEAKVTVEAPDKAQVYFRPLGAVHFSEQTSVTQAVSPSSDGQRLVFRLRSATGFDDTLRLDPVERPQEIRISDVKIICRKRLYRP